MPSYPAKFLFAISDTGGGHRSAASAISDALQQCSDATCITTDILRTTRFPGLRQAPEIYDYCSKKLLWINNLFFRNTNNVSRIKTLTKMVYLQSGQHIEHELLTLRPDAVIAVHPLVTGLLSLARKRLGAIWPIITVVTDLVTIHASWATPGADLYLAPTREVMTSLIQYGVPEHRIVFTGFPIHPKFTQTALTKAEARKLLAIDPGRFTVLLTGGGVGAGGLSEWVAALTAQCAGKQILAVTGKNKNLYDQLTAGPPQEGLHVYGFIDNMEVFMAASDMIITKAGPGTIMEGAAMKRPLIVTEAVGIQETGNIDYVKRNLLGYHCPLPGSCCTVINEISANAGQGSSIYSPRSIEINGSARIARIILQQAGAGRRPESGNIVQYGAPAS
ncbi:MAG TPA: glycosyltransferase [Selenomonadales bacterium]|nr:glycosyltransferase [Selenomonadales bacterium]